MSEERLVFFRKALKEVSKALVKAVSELWTERTAAILQTEQTERELSDLDQLQWRETPLSSNQPTMESF